VSSTNPPKTLADLQARITSEHTQLSRRLQQVSHYVMENPNSVAFDTLAVIAKSAGVHPSTLVRFANAFGFSGFSELQMLYKERLMETSPDYNQRIRKMLEKEGDADQASPEQLLGEFARANMLALEGLLHDIDPQRLQRAVEVLAEAETIYITGMRRSFPVATYLNYTLRHIKCRCALLDGNAGMLPEQAQFMGESDTLIVVTFKPYAQESRDLVAQAKSLGTKVVLITDSELSPPAPAADVLFIVKDAEVRAFRSLGATLCLAQTLCISLAFYLAENPEQIASLNAARGEQGS
jgi:DNA-binding MurR/RpiR family transcriptional regulator